MDSTITEAQQRCISYELGKFVPYREGMLGAIESLDKSTASDVIGMLKRGDRDMAVRQLHHVFPNLF